MSDSGDKPDPAEHLGWRASSSMPSKKRNYIEGVSGKGVVELQAQLYRTQEHARMRGDGLPAAGLHDRHVRRKAGIDVAAIKNKGVEAREARDKALSLKATGSGKERLAESAAALERKAALYERLAAQGGAGDEQEDEKYEVEFWRKGASYDEEQWQQQQREQDWLAGEGGGGPLDSAQAAVDGSGAMMTQDMARERERREWEAKEEARMAAEAEAAARREAHRAAVKELSAQTQAGRDEAAVNRAFKDEAVAAKRARLKAAFLQQQLQAIKSGKQQKAAAAAATGGSNGSGSNGGGSSSSKQKGAGS